MNSKPLRIQRSRQHKQVSPNGLPIVYAGRPSKWGNPFTIGINNIEELDLEFFDFADLIEIKDIIDCLEIYNIYLNQMVEAEQLNLSGLHDKNISCWCKLCDKHKHGKPFDVDCPDCEPCHVDILLKLANK